MLSILQPTRASALCAARLRDRIAGPITALYLENVVSIFALLLYPELVCQSRFPRRSLALILRLRSLDVGDFGAIRAPFFGGIRTRGDRS